MQFHPTGTDPTKEARMVCRNARFNLVIFLLIFGGAPFFWWWVEAPGIVTYGCAALALFLIPILLGSWRRRGRPDNWVLAFYRDGVWVNMRDCEYYLAEPGETVVYLPYDEILSVSKSIHRYKTPSDDGDVSHKDIFLALQLEEEHAKQIGEKLKRERSRKPAKKTYLWGAVTVSNKGIQHQPVKVSDDGLLKVKFSAGNFGLRPGIKKVLAFLQQHIAVDGQSESKTADWEKLSEAEFVEFVKQMVLDGDTIDATALLRRRKKMSLTQAHEFVEEIERQLAAERTT